MHSFIHNLLLVAPALLFSLVAHEWAHAYAALKQGDPTAYRLGRLTFNPIKHIDPFMTIVLPAILLWSSGGTMAIGGAKPCPVDPRNYRNYRRGDLIVSLAGVAMNALLAIVAAVLVFVIGVVGRALPDAASVLGIVQRMAEFAISVNCLLIFFNLLPIPPLDGSHVVKHLLPARAAIRYMRSGAYGMLLLLALLYFGGPVNAVWLTPSTELTRLLQAPVASYLLPSP